MQEPGEHPYCGDGLIPASGLSYLPEEFYRHGIAFYNFGWPDHSTTDLPMLIKIIKTVESELKGGRKIAVHCHAGRGRTALVICGFLMYKDGLSADKAVKLFRDKRVGSLKQESQVRTLREFEKFLKEQRTNYFCGKEYFDILKSEKTLGVAYKVDDSYFNFSMVVFLKNYFDRLKEICGEITPKEFYKSFYDEREGDVSNIKKSLRDFSKTTTAFEQIKDVWTLNKLFIAFFENLPVPFLTREGLKSLSFLTKERLTNISIDFNSFKVQRHINADEVGPLFLLKTAFSRYNERNTPEFELCFFRIALAFLKTDLKAIDCFKNKALIRTDWNYNKELTRFKTFIDEFFDKKNKGSLLRVNVNIVNSPLKTFTKMKESNGLQTVIDSFMEVEEDQIVKLFGKCDREGQKEILEKLGEIFKKGNKEGKGVSLVGRENKEGKGVSLIGKINKQESKPNHEDKENVETRKASILEDD